MNREELVQKMWDAYSDRHESDPRPLVAGMFAALDVAIDVLLAPLTAQERGDAGAAYLSFNGTINRDYREILQFTLKNFIANRRTRFMHHKTIEERVTIEQQGVTFAICLDGNVEFSFGRRERAEIYRKGLIADLKEKEAGVGA